MDNKIIYLSEQGFNDLKNELNHLVTVERPNIIKQIAEARDKGDLSENAEYDAAKESQGLLEAKISKLELDLSNARILDESNVDTSTVRLLTHVTIENLENSMQMSYIIVSESEADITAKKISSSSPIGKGLLGKKEGDIVDINVPNGTVKFKIISIKSS
ncbi:MAG: transcription elongation factor GreA [Flavobacteriales bacterium]|nr:transcription elongation factor GreA [Flavobacteriales bacterium]|tara:strand:+ start:3892 stop:4371 length:480 start_codon:yes stop_codon:yes gene_type:complete